MKTRTPRRKNAKGEDVSVTIQVGDFNKSNVLEILNNRVYVGLRKYGTEFYQSIHEAIVTEEKFNKVQELLASSYKYTQTNRKTTSALILHGVTKCGFCGSTLTTSTGKSGKYYYYKCSKQAHQTKSECPAKQLPVGVLENFAIQSIVHLAEEDTFCEKANKQIEFNKEGELQKLKDELMVLRTNRTKLETKVKNIWDRMSLDPNRNNSEKYMSQIDLKKEEIVVLDEKIRVIEKQIRNINASKLDKAGFKNMLTRFIEMFRRLPIEKQKWLTKLVFAEIVSEFKTGDKDGLITLKIRGNGVKSRLWSQIESENCKPVLTSIGFGSASKTRTCNPSVNPATAGLYH